jgi:hypothetical protein
MEEKTFFSYDDVKVTSSRFISGGQTFAMSNITSVKAFEKKPYRTGGIIALLVGLSFVVKEVLLGVPSVESVIFGIAIAALAVLYLYKQKTIYHVMLATAGGETSALKTYQKEYLDRVVGALNQAIVYRG